MYFKKTYLDAEPLEVDDSHEVFMMDDGDTPPPEMTAPAADEFDMSNGTVVWA